MRGTRGAGWRGLRDLRQKGGRADAKFASHGAVKRGGGGGLGYPGRRGGKRTEDTPRGNLARLASPDALAKFNAITCLTPPTAARPLPFSGDSSTVSWALAAIAANGRVSVAELRVLPLAPSPPPSCYGCLTSSDTSRLSFVSLVSLPPPPLPSTMAQHEQTGPPSTPASPPPIAISESNAVRPSTCGDTPSDSKAGVAKRVMEATAEKLSRGKSLLAQSQPALPQPGHRRMFSLTRGKGKERLAHDGTSFLPFNICTDAKPSLQDPYRLRSPKF